MSKSKISRDEMRRRVEAKERGEGVGEQGSVRVTVWSGMRNYECRMCAYATLDVGAMAGHLKAVHGWVESPLANPLPEGEGTGDEGTAAAVVDEEQ